MHMVIAENKPTLALLSRLNSAIEQIASLRCDIYTVWNNSCYYNSTLTLKEYVDYIILLDRLDYTAW
jgi:hypothetical protein